VAEIGAQVIVDRDGFAAVLRALTETGHQLIGPTVRDGAIVLDTLRGVDDLPRGVGDDQAPGRYRLRDRGDDALFGFAVSPHSFKRDLLPPRVDLVQIRRTKSGLETTAAPLPSRKVAYLGIRGCELAAIAVQDRVLADGAHPDADYRARRDGVFVLAVHCGSPAGTCFCVSMGTGPRARSGYDLGATELVDRQCFVLEIASEAGRAIVDQVTARDATSEELAAAARVTDDAAAHMGRAMPQAGIRDLLVDNLEHPRWDDVAARCLGCANCTMSCPTCFCTSIDDTTDLSGDVATRTRRWDSCFTADFAYVHGGSVRPSLRARYRQWMTHKLATWHDQFGSSGCVGCGRCITWCPVGIDITEEVAAIRAAGSASDG